MHTHHQYGTSGPRYSAEILCRGCVCGQAVKKAEFAFSEACVGAVSHQALVSFPPCFLERMLDQGGPGDGSLNTGRLQSEDTAL